VRWRETDNTKTRAGARTLGYCATSSARASTAASDCHAISTRPPWRRAGRCSARAAWETGATAQGEAAACLHARGQRVSAAIPLRTFPQESGAGGWSERARAKCGTRAPPTPSEMPIHNRSAQR
jgi:hypothetical protein